MPGISNNIDSIEYSSHVSTEEKITLINGTITWLSHFPTLNISLQDKLRSFKFFVPSVINEILLVIINQNIPVLSPTIYKDEYIYSEGYYTNIFQIFINLINEDYEKYTSSNLPTFIIKNLNYKKLLKIHNFFAEQKIDLKNLQVDLTNPIDFCQNFNNEKKDESLEFQAMITQLYWLCRLFIEVAIHCEYSTFCINLISFLEDENENKLLHQHLLRDQKNKSCFSVEDKNAFSISNDAPTSSGENNETSNRKFLDIINKNKFEIEELKEFNSIIEEENNKLKSSIKSLRAKNEKLNKNLKVSLEKNESITAELELLNSLDININSASKYSNINSAKSFEIVNTGNANTGNTNTGNTYTGNTAESFVEISSNSKSNLLDTKTSENLTLEYFNSIRWELAVFEKWILDTAGLTTAGLATAGLATAGLTAAAAEKGC
ncbi:hypothetical protein PACTADRAFT_31836 [Pachysolen tannophilus NRRL Y-2460]|uniref:Uncharacterized protein n=1 Tax=Pachysolen tannophilus NRRL Y-2460 TaxID=669874 RepID=A0A1E4U361_PACTA|nr:hypothetical protein PACTADRAFT_31836 [Pachysolen tannophilus NRRL Y-2460]